MTLSLDISADWSIVDSTSTITFRRRLTESTFANGVSVAAVLGRVVSREEMEARGLLARAGKVWHIWAVKLPGTVPKTHDVIEDSAGVRWTILKVDTTSWETRFQVWTIQERQ